MEKIWIREAAEKCKAKNTEVMERIHYPADVADYEEVITSVYKAYLIEQGARHGKVQSTK